MTTHDASRVFTPTHRPEVNAGEAAAIARRLYGLDGPVDELPSERDRNFRITAVSGERFVLKISHADEDPALLDLQHRVLRRLAERTPDLAVPSVRDTLEGEPVGSIEAAGRTHAVRLVTWLPGRPMVAVPRHSPALLGDLGRVLGTLDAALDGFEHAASERPFKWDLRHACDVIDECRRDVDDEGRRRRVDRLLDRFRSKVVPRLGALRQGLVHNDANDHNVLVESRLDDQRVVGLIDFGDVVRSYVIGEVAVAAAYAVLDKRDPLAAAAAILAGYHAVHPVTEDEVAVLHDLVCMRLCVSVTNSARERKREPDNEYLGVSETPAWAALERLEAIAPALATAVYRDACGWEPCPRSGAVVSWLRAHAGAFAPLLDADLSPENLHCLDLSVGGDDVETAMAELDRLDGVVGIGRYDEPRLVYSTDGYKHPTDDRLEWRTIHLGLDLFAPAGTAVLAPLAGTVHGFRDNAIDKDYGPTIILRHEPADGVELFTLYGHLSRASLEGLEIGQAFEAGDDIATLGDETVNGGWPPHLHFQIVTDMLGRDGEFPGVAPPSRRRVWTSLSPDANLIAGVPSHVLLPPAASQAEILDARRRHLGPTLSVAYRRPLTIVRGEAMFLFDDTGLPFLDAVNNVCHVGHCHPHVVAAGRDQMGRLNTNTRYLHELLGTYAARLAATLPDPLEVCFLVCSGSEANELALRLARTATGGRDMVVLAGGYHGNTTSLIDVSSYKFDGRGGSGAPPHVHVAADLADPDSIRDAVARATAGDRRFAAFIAEAMPGCAGQIILPPGYLEQAYAHVRAAGGICIADEVQTGFGRPGTHMWAFETQGVVPDIVTLGKPIGNGHPMGAVVTTRAVAEAFVTGMEYFNTFGGNPVSCAIGMAVLDVIEDEELQANAKRVGDVLLEGFRELQTRHEIIGDARGWGLYLGVELVKDRDAMAPAPEEASYAVNRMRDAGVLMSTDGPHDNVLKVKPPLVFQEDHAVYLLDTLDRVLGEIR